MKLIVVALVVGINVMILPVRELTKGKMLSQAQQLKSAARHFLLTLIDQQISDISASKFSDIRVIENLQKRVQMHWYMCLWIDNSPSSEAMLEAPSAMSLSLTARRHPWLYLALRSHRNSSSVKEHLNGSQFPQLQKYNPGG